MNYASVFITIGTAIMVFSSHTVLAGHLSNIASRVLVMQMSAETTGGAIAHYLLTESGRSSEDANRLITYALEPESQPSFNWFVSCALTSSPLSPTEKAVADFIRSKNTNKLLAYDHKLIQAWFKKLNYSDVRARKLAQLLINDGLTTNYPTTTLPSQLSQFKDGIVGELDNDRLTELRKLVYKPFMASVSTTNVRTGETLQVAEYNLALWIYINQTGDIELLRKFWPDTFPVLTSLLSDFEDNDAIAGFILDCARDVIKAAGNVGGQSKHSDVTVMLLAKAIAQHVNVPVIFRQVYRWLTAVEAAGPFAKHVPLFLQNLNFNKLDRTELERLTKHLYSLVESYNSAARDCRYPLIQGWP